MLVMESVARLPGAMRGGVATIGNFDGVHLGHRMIINAMQSVAAPSNLPTIAITFNPHPRSVLNPLLQPFHILTTLEEKIALLEEAGLTAALVIPFTENFSAMPAADFVRETLCAGLSLRHLFVGHDYAFGKNKGGDAALLGHFAASGAFQLQVLEAYRGSDGGIISSTAIRHAILAGDLPHATRRLGRFYDVSGKVIRGAGRGATLGFPTANVLPNKTLLPPRGVYASIVTVDGARFGGALNVGVNPTFGGTHLSVEVFLLGYAGDLYDCEIKVEFVERIRSEKTFGSVAELVAQINMDVESVRGIVAPWLSG